MFTVLLLIAGRALLFAQHDDKTNFERIFLRELKVGGHQPLRKEQFSMGVSELPNWFWNIPESNDSVSYTIGISDPEMEDSIKAGRQALDRALMQQSLMCGAKVSGVSDLYNNNEQNKYEEYYKLISNAFFVGTYCAVDSFITRYREKIVLVKLDRTSRVQNNLFAGIEVYKCITKAEIGWFNSEKINYLLTTDSDKMMYQYVQDENRCQLLSEYNTDTISIPSYQYEYHILSSENINDSEEPVIKLHQKGLWTGYFQAFIEGLQLFSENNKLRLKSLDEICNNYSGRNSTNSLNRLTMNNRILFRIRKIESQYNELNMTFYLSKQ